ncbi:MAG: hypothetical protein ACREPI_11045 [Candidatus Dormibacterales bacterium]
MDDRKRDILARVAQGRLQPSEAAAMLEELEAGPAPLPASGLETVRVRMDLGAVQVVGDTSVREASAEGGHEARREGSVLIVEGEGAFPSDRGFQFGRRGRDRAGRGFQFGRRGAAGLTRQLVVRMNPDLRLEAEVQAGSLSVSGLRGPIRAEIQAGSASIEDFRSPLDISVQAGSLRAWGVLDRGDSRISCEAGTVKLHLARGSSVRITTR